MDADVYTILWTLILDFFFFLCCYFLWIVVSDQQPLHVNFLLPHTWKYRVIGRTVYSYLCCGCEWHWLSYLLCWRHRQKDGEHPHDDDVEQAKSVSPVGAIICEPAPGPAEETMDAAALPSGSQQLTAANLRALAAATEAFRKQSDATGSNRSPLTAARRRLSSAADGERKQASEIEMTAPLGAVPASPPTRASNRLCLASDASSGQQQGPRLRTLTIAEALGTDQHEVQAVRRPAVETAGSRPSSISMRKRAPAPQPSVATINESSVKNPVSVAPTPKSTRFAMQPVVLGEGTAIASIPENAATSGAAPSDLPPPRHNRAASHLNVLTDGPAFDTLMVPVVKMDATAPAAAVHKHHHAHHGSTSLAVVPSTSRHSVSHNAAHHSTSHRSHTMASGGGGGGEEDEGPDFHPDFHEDDLVTEAAAAAATKDAKAEEEVVSHPVTIVPVQEGVAAQEQVLVTPPRHKLRFQYVEPLLELIFPKIRILGANAVDGFIYLKYLQLLIVMTAVMTAISLAALLPVHQEANPDPDATSFKKASIASVPAGTDYYFTHMGVAFLFLILLHIFVRMLARHGVKATKLSTVLTDDKETIAARRTIHIHNMDLHASMSEAALKDEIMALLPPGTSPEQILSISLYHDTPHIRKALNKKLHVVDQIERLEILASQAASPEATKKIKAMWLKVLHAPGTLSVPERLQVLRNKKDKYTKLIAAEVWKFYEAAAVADNEEEWGENFPLAMQHRRVSTSVAPGCPTVPVDGVGSIAAGGLAPNQTGHWASATAPHRGAGPSGVLSPISPPGALSPGGGLSAGGMKPATKKEKKAKSKEDAAIDALPYARPTGQAFVSFRASALAGEVVKKHRQVRARMRMRLEHLGLHNLGAHGHHPHNHLSHKASQDHLKSPGPNPAGKTPGANGALSPSPAALCSPSPGMSPDPAHAAPGQPGHLCRMWTVSFAPKPSDIIWENLGVDQENLVLSGGRWLVANAGLIALVLFVGVPTLIVARLRPMIASQTGSGTLEPGSARARIIDFITNYIVTLLMYIINTNYSPFIMTKALDFEHHPTKSAYLASQFFKSSLFLFVNMILLPIFAMNTISDLFEKLRTSNEATWYQILGSAFFSKTGVYFAQYLIHSIFITTGLVLLDLPTYLKRVWALRTALTKADFEAAEMKTTASTGYNMLLAVFGLILLNSVSMPLLCPFGLAFFITQYNIDIYYMRHFPVVARNNKGTIPTMVARYTLLYVALWEFLMAALWFTQQRPSFYAVGVVFAVLGAVTLGIYFLKEFSTLVPIDLSISALQHLDEKITIFKELNELMPRLRTGSVSVKDVLESQTAMDRSKESSKSSYTTSESENSQTEAAILTEHLLSAEPPGVHCEVEENHPHLRPDAAAATNAAPSPFPHPLVKHDRLTKLPEEHLGVLSSGSTSSPSPRAKFTRSLRPEVMYVHEHSFRVLPGFEKPTSPLQLQGPPGPSATPAAAVAAGSSTLGTPSAAMHFLSPQPSSATPAVTPATANAAAAAGAEGMFSPSLIIISPPPAADSPPAPAPAPTADAVPVVTAPAVANDVSAPAADSSVSSPLARPRLSRANSAPHPVTCAPAPAAMTTFLDDFALHRPRLDRLVSPVMQHPLLRHEGPAAVKSDPAANSIALMHRKSLDLFSPKSPDAEQTGASAEPIKSYMHPHAHRPPLSKSTSHSHAIHSSLRHLSCVDSSICPDCLYRNPIWKKIEADAEVMAELANRERVWNELLAAATSNEAPTGDEHELAADVRARDFLRGVTLHTDADEDDFDDSSDDDDAGEEARRRAEDMMVAAMGGTFHGHQKSNQQGSRIGSRLSSAASVSAAPEVIRFHVAEEEEEDADAYPDEITGSDREATPHHRKQQSSTASTSMRSQPKSPIQSPLDMQRRLQQQQAQEQKQQQQQQQPEHHTNQSSSDHSRVPLSPKASIQSDDPSLALQAAVAEQFTLGDAAADSSSAAPPPSASTANGGAAAK